jgi:hypothetical protein
VLKGGDVAAGESSDERNVGMLKTRRNGIVVGVVTTVVALCGTGGMVGVGSARAGEYHVYGCRTPDGQVAPTDGWSGNASGAFVYDEDKCSKKGALIAALGDGVEHEPSDLASWTFDAPIGETLAGAALWRAGNADGGSSKTGTYEFWLAGPEDNEAFDECVFSGSPPCQAGEGEPEEPLAVANKLVLAQPHLGSHLHVNAACFAPLGLCKKGEHDPSGYAAVVYLYASDLTLEQSTQPTVSSVEGELATAATLSGVADLAFHAEDPGSGVYEAVFTVDGSPTGTTLIDENGGHCRDVGQTTDSLPAFLYLQPCKSSLNADLPLDTSTLTDGTHHLVVSVTNAAGNSTVALDRKIAILNHPGSSPLPGSTPVATGNALDTGHAATTQNLLPPNGTNASPAARLVLRWPSTAHTALAAPYGRSHTLRGHLTATDGSPIGGATLQVLYTPAYQGASPRSLASVRTSTDGSLQVRLPASMPSSRITLAYSSHSGQPSPDITAALMLVVPASLSLRVTPTVSHVGDTISFTGSLRGSPLPRGGKQLVLEARAPGGSWRQFRVLSTLPHGRYRSTYRFRLPGPITYEFRTTSPHEADFPYGAGASRVVRVRER